MSDPTKTYRAVTYGNFQLDLPEFNWGVSVSVDTFNFEDKQPYRVFWQMEPPGILDIWKKVIQNHKFYDLILAWHPEIISECGNAKLFPPGAVWCQSDDTSQKKFSASFLISSKRICDGHRFRVEIYDCLPDHCNNLPIVKHKSPPYLPTKESMLIPHQFAIVMENAMIPNNFTEKVNDAFATKTIPIYWGASNLGNFYNPEGFYQFETFAGLMRVLKGLTPDTYASKKEAIEDNYLRALKYADRTGNVARAIIESWTPNITKIHSGLPNVETKK
jgi:hypothetical protein